MGRHFRRGKENNIRPFLRGSSSGQRGDDGGTGLGLSLVQEDARLHGGRVWVEDSVTKSETNQGLLLTTFKGRR